MMCLALIVAAQKAKIRLSHKRSASQCGKIIGLVLGFGEAEGSGAT